MQNEHASSNTVWIQVQAHQSLRVLFQINDNGRRIIYIILLCYTEAFRRLDRPVSQRTCCAALRFRCRIC